MQRRAFFRAWLVEAFGTPWTLYERLSTVFGLLLFLLAQAGVINRESSLNDWATWIGVTLFSVMVLGRLVMSPYWIHERDQREMDALRGRLQTVATDPWSLKVVVEFWDAREVFLHILNLSREARVSLTFEMLVELQNGSQERWHHCVTDQKHVPTHLSLGPSEDRAGVLVFAPFRWHALRAAKATLEITDRLSDRRLSVAGRGVTVWS